MKKKLQGWWMGNARGQPSAEASTPLRDIDVVAENDKKLGLGSETEYDMKGEYEAEIGLSTEAEYKETPEEAFVMEVEHESMSDTSATMSPRERAVEGMRRRREAKRPVRKKLVAMGGNCIKFFWQALLHLEAWQMSAWWSLGWTFFLMLFTAQTMEVEINRSSWRSSPGQPTCLGHLQLPGVG